MQEPKTKPKYFLSNVPKTTRFTFFLKTAGKKKQKKNKHPKQTSSVLRIEQQPALFGCQVSKRLLVRTGDISLFQSCLTSCPQDLLSGCDENFPSTIRTIAKHRMAALSQCARERERERAALLLCGAVTSPPEARPHFAAASVRHGCLLSKRSINDSSREFHCSDKERLKDLGGPHTSGWVLCNSLRRLPGAG